MPIGNTKKRILDYLESNNETSPHELSNYLEISPQAMFRHLKSLLSQNEIEKIGSSPKVYYRLSKSQIFSPKELVSESDKEFLKDTFYFVSPIGENYEGLEAMQAWCKRQDLPMQKTINEYKETLLKYDCYKKNGQIDGLSKIQSTFKQTYLDKLYYLDFYAIERFGKTRLGYYLLYSKQGQSLSFMRQLVNFIKPKIEAFVNASHFDAIAFAPPTVKREFQIMNMIEKECNFGLPIVKIEKIKTPIIVPQKTLSKLTDRIQNAQNTMLVTEKNNFNTILLIDDAVGSGSTLNEIAKQLKSKNVARYVTGLALTGSFKGFDVISEV